jgi:uncharacterized repeat protein (TIGR01451 family)
MRHLPLVLCASVVACGYGSLASAVTNPPLTFTLDLLGPCTATGCSGSHPTDIGLDLTANSFTYTAGAGGTFVSTIAVNSPVVCDEISSDKTLGPKSLQRLAPTYANATPGGLLEFNAGGASVVDLNTVLYDGQIPLAAVSYSNYGVVLPPQVVCYQVNPVSGGPVAVAAGPYGIFSSGFDSQHFASEPWLSVQTVFAPHASGSKSGSQPNGITVPNTMGYVVQIHNAANAVGWHLDLGYDYSFFDTISGGTPPVWCILDAGIPQPGPVNGSPISCGVASSAHTLSLADIQPGSSSIYVYVESGGSSGAVSSWNSLTSAIYPAVAAIFPPFGTYPQRFDDKSVVSTASNLPTLNIGSIVCNNDTVSTACVISDPDGNPVPTAVTFANSISGSGTVNADPLAYFVDPASGSTLPGNVAADALLVSGISCNDPNSILASPIGQGNFTQSLSAQGGTALGFTFNSSGSPNFPYVAGTATCTATFAANYLPSLQLSSTQSFTITMQQSLVGSVTLSAPAGPAAPRGNLTYTMVVANAGTSALTNVLATDNQAGPNFTVASWTCTATGATCPHASNTGNLAETIPTLPVGGSLSYAITGTVGNIDLNPVAQITNAGSITVPGGSCTGGLCSGTASVATVPIISVAMSETPQTYLTVGDPVAYTITLTNQGGTDATGLSLADPSSAGLDFAAWTCAATGVNSSCANLLGSGAINESNLGIGAGGNVAFGLAASVTVPSGNITNTASASGLNGGAVCLNGSCVAQQTLTGP